MSPVGWACLGLALGLMINRQGKKPLIRRPVRCWFFGHAWNAKHYRCDRCHLYEQVDEHTSRFDNTFWTV